MQDYETVKARWEGACRRYLDSKGAYTDGEREEMWFLCKTLEKILELPEGASREYIQKESER